MLQDWMSWCFLKWILQDFVSPEGFFSLPRHKLADQKTRKSLGREEFRLSHYAGDVTYSVAGNTEKTKNLGIKSIPTLFDQPD